MNAKPALDSPRRQRWKRRATPWLGGLFICVIAGMAVYDIVRSYRDAVDGTGRELDAQARVIAEQTARSLQAVDVLLRHVAEQFRVGTLSALGPQDLGAYLQEQAVGLVQIDGLVMFDASGALRASSFAVPPQPQPISATHVAVFQALRDNRNLGAYIDNALRSLDGQWVFPIGRRLESTSGEFAGVVGARGRIDYFQQFYRDVRLDEGTTVTLMHQRGMLLARHPPAESALGQHFPLFDDLLARRRSGAAGPTHTASPVDGVERFGALELVPGYPLAIIATRDTATALAPWRAQAAGTAVRTLALSVLAALLIAIVTRQLSRLSVARESLETSQERYALAVAGSEGGIWDFDLAAGRVFGSKRGREILGLPPGPETQSMDEWFGALEFHPDDAPRRLAAMDAHLAGDAPAYEGEFRVRLADGDYRWVRIHGVCVRDATGKPYRMAGSVIDIDARKRAEEALRLSEERYALALIGSDEGHWVWDTVKDELFASATMKELFGLAADAQVSTWAGFFERIGLHPDDLQSVQQAFDDHLSGRSPKLDLEHRIVPRDGGQIRWVHSRGQCFRDDNGKPVRIAGSTVDITERKRTDESLRQSEERYALAMTGLSGGHWVWDVATDELYVSAKVNQLFGLPEDLQPRTRAEYYSHVTLHPDDEVRVMQAGDDLVTDGSRGFEYRIILPGSGEVRWVLTRAQSFRGADGKAVRMAGVSVDITERKRTEEALRQSEERFALAVAGSDDGVWDWDFNARLAFESARARELQGLPPGPELQPLDDLLESLRVHPDDAPRRAEGIRAHLAGETPAYECEYRVRHDDGEYRWIRVRALCIRDAAGKPCRMAGSVSDIDAKKRAEEALRVSEERYALVMTGTNEGHWLWNIREQRVYVSAKLAELLGLAGGAQEMADAEYFAGLPLHPEDRERVHRNRNDHVAGLTPRLDHEFRIIVAATGEVRWMHTRAQCFRDDEGHPLRLAGSTVDATQRKRAEAALRESEERFALAVAGSNDGIVDWDIVNDRMFASERARRIAGVDADLTIRTHAQWSAVLKIHPDDRDRREQDLQDHLDGRTEMCDGEYRMQQPDGVYRWVRVRGTSVRDAAGRPIRWAGSLSDVDEQKRIEQALRHSEERYQLAVAGSNEGLWDWDVQHDMLFLSARAQDMMGLPFSGPLSPRPEWVDLAAYRRGDLHPAYTAPQAEIAYRLQHAAGTVRPRNEWGALLKIHPDDRRRYDDDVERLINGEADTRDGEYRMQQADGAYRWVRVRGMAVRDDAGRAVRWAGSVSDIDERVRAEQALRQSDERYKLAVAGSNEGLWDWDLQHDMLFLSARAQTLMGLEPSEPLRPRREWIDRSTYHPDDLDRVRQAISAHLKGDTPHFEAEYRMRHASGEWHWYRQRGVAVRDASGRPYRLAGSMEDISRRREAEDERERLEKQLRQAQKLEAIGTLAGGIAHDFNNILSAILGYGEMAQKDTAEGTALRRHIDAALSAGMRAKSLVERILAFSRSGMGERVPVHVQSVVEEAVDVVAASLPPGVRVDRKLSAGDAAVLGDPTQVHQVVMNLCANAIQAMKASGVLTVALDVATLSGSIAATSTLAAGTYVRLSVRDTGTGIAPHVLERIFDPFFTTKEIGVGTGLGLSLVHGIVTDLGGGIDVASRVGEGSTFTVHLPWQGAVVAAPVVAEEDVPNGGGETILLVDDEEALVRLGEEMIAELGYEPVGFTSSEAALQSFREAPERFNAVLSDEAMPDMTGSELAIEIRKIRPDIPIVLMSGFVTQALSARARDAGVIDVLSKPLAARDIARCLANALRSGATI